VTVNDQIREQLIGYVLGALEDSEVRQVEQQLEEDPQWRAELAEVQKSLEPLVDAYEVHDPPPDLVQKTCQFVQHESERLHIVRPYPVRACRQEVVLEGGFDTRSRWRLADWVVLGGVCLAAAALFFPAILNSRLTSRIAFCQNNLRELGIALTQFSEATHERFFPTVPTEGNRSFAGVYAPILCDGGYISDAGLLVCPESPPVSALHRIPSLDEVDLARGDRILILQQRAGGSYAYSVGYLVNGRHCTARNQGRSYYAIMADAPSLDWKGPSHGNGVNVLYEDMHVKLIAGRGDPVPGDDPFRNLLGRPEAGIHGEDAVCSPSHSPPFLTTVSLNSGR
jgi:hypothetical protein